MFNNFIPGGEKFGLTWGGVCEITISGDAHLVLSLGNYCSERREHLAPARRSSSSILENLSAAELTIDTLSCKYARATLAQIINPAKPRETSYGA